MSPVLACTDDLLRGEGRFSPAAAEERRWWWLPGLVLIFAPIYGGVMGSFQLDSAARIMQVIYSASKVPLLLGVTSLLCLPGFFVMNTVLGLRDDLRDSLRAILAGQAALSVALASLAPLTRVWYFSSDSYRAALLFNAGVFALATLAGQIVMFRYYRVLIRRNAHHRLMAYLWLVLYWFVGIQMGWMLRPFVGDPSMRVSFFR